MNINIEREHFTGYIDHVYKGHNVRLHGRVLGINESDATATMRFDNGFVSDGIPMEVIELDEGLLDALKKGAKRIAGYISMAGDVVMDWIKSISNARGNFLGVIWSPAMKKTARTAGISARDIPFKSDDSDSGILNRDLRRMIDIIKERNGVSESMDAYKPSDLKAAYLQMVTENYGAAVAKDINENYNLNNFFGGMPKLDEATQDPAGGNAPTEVEQNIPNRNIGEIVSLLTLQLELTFKSGSFSWINDKKKTQKFAQERYLQACHDIANDRTKGLPYAKNLSDDEVKEMAKHDAYDFISQARKLNNIKSTKPLMIWGAPGIGKTTIIQQASAVFNKKIGYQHRVTMLETVLSKMEHDDWGLSFLDENNRDTGYWDPDSGKPKPRLTVTAPVSWLPIYQEIAGDDAGNEYRRRAANYMGNSPESTQKAGIIGDNAYRTFLDKYNDEHGTDYAPGVGSTLSTDAMNTMTNYAENPQEYINKLQAERVKTAPQLADSPAPAAPAAPELSAADLEKYPLISTGTKPNDAGILPGTVCRTKKGKLYVANKAGTNWSPYKGPIGESLDIFADTFFNSMNEDWGSFDFDDFEKNSKSADKITNVDGNLLYDGGILFMDEFTRAKHDVMNTAMNLINDRNYGNGWYLAPHWIIVCAGNRYSEMADATGNWEPAFGTRFTQVTFIPKFADWKRWAQGYDINPDTGKYDISKHVQPRIDQDIIDFLTKYQEHWYDVTHMMADGDDGNKTYGNPRSWTTASNQIYQEASRRAGGDPNAAVRDVPTTDKTLAASGHKDRYYKLDRRVKTDIVKNAAGLAVANKFDEYLQNKSLFSDEVFHNYWEFGNAKGIKNPTPSQIAKKDTFVPRDTKTDRLLSMEQGLATTFITELFRPGRCPDDPDLMAQWLTHEQYLNIMKGTLGLGARGIGIAGGSTGSIMPLITLVGNEFAYYLMALPMQNGKETFSARLERLANSSDPSDQAELREWGGIPIHFGMASDPGFKHLQDEIMQIAKEYVQDAYELTRYQVIPTKQNEKDYMDMDIDTIETDSMKNMNASNNTISV